MQKETSPYTCHVFVCTNDRHGERKSCADGGGNAALKDYLKEQVEKRGWKGRVRVSSGGCMGLCGKGPNVMIYPQKAWFAVASPADGDRILEEIETAARRRKRKNDESSAGCDRQARRRLLNRRQFLKALGISTLALGVGDALAFADSPDGQPDRPFSRGFASSMPMPTPSGTSPRASAPKTPRRSRP